MPPPPLYAYEQSPETQTNPRYDRSSRRPHVRYDIVIDIKGGGGWHWKCGDGVGQGDELHLGGDRLGE